jgi:hypothetical protein
MVYVAHHARRGDVARAKLRFSTQRRPLHWLEPRRERTARRFEFAARLPTVQRALYLVFNEGYHGASKHSVVRSELCGEAMRLTAELLRHPFGARPGTYALAALMWRLRAIPWSAASSSGVRSLAAATPRHSRPDPSDGAATALVHRTRCPQRAGSNVFAPNHNPRGDSHVAQHSRPGSQRPS